MNFGPHEPFAHLRGKSPGYFSQGSLELMFGTQSAVASAMARAEESSDNGSNEPIGMEGMLGLNPRLFWQLLRHTRKN